MSKPYKLSFPSPPRSEKNARGNLPPWCKYKLMVADEAFCMEFDHAGLLIQRLENDAYVIDLLQVETTAPFLFNYELEVPKLFMYFMLQGTAEFTNEAGELVATAQTNQFYVTHNRQGTYQAICKGRRNISLIIALDALWVGKIGTNLPNLKGMIQHYASGEEPFGIFPRRSIDDTVGKWLKEIHSYSNENPGIMDGRIRMYIAMILEYYDGLLEKLKSTIGYRAKIYMDDHYLEQELTNASLADHLQTSERTMRNQFKALFNMTPHAYLARLRMQKAKFLHEFEKLPLSQIYALVGYNDERSFRYVYKKAFGIKETAS